MAGIDLPTAQAKLDLWLQAEEKLASGQSITIDGRTLTRASLGEVAGRVAYWNRWIQRLSHRGGPIAARRTAYRDG